VEHRQGEIAAMAISALTTPFFAGQQHRKGVDSVVRPVNPRAASGRSNSKTSSVSPGGEP
jgi:hypothetical protein